ncbi:MAG TPA: hydantoinase B/oxoprolinase family protein [Candidatus Eisenbacteria bacterium]|nr:hydantoinase B/oxoprolinase family protein [Candidatus Eisenbacteria bacterium]
MTLDPIQAGIVWTRLASITEEVATVLLRTSFTPVVREAGDLSAGIFDRNAHMIAQAVTGTPGHINTMATAVRHFADRFPLDSLAPGDALATNDPWLASGHLHDVTLVSPLFHRGRAIGWCANTCHMADIGGRTLGAEGLDVFEEGFRLPILKLFERGVMPPLLHDLIAANVRAPEMVLGDLQAMATANLRAEERLGELLEDLKFPDLEEVSESILGLCERAVRERIGALPDGIASGEVMLDGFEEPVTLRARVHIEGDRLSVDYAGSSPQVREGINVVHSYTHAYTTYALAALLFPDVPHNAGSFRPIEVTAPVGSILNTQFPAPVAARHIIGHFLPGAVYAALSGLIPERVPADGAYGLWASQFEGARANGTRYVFTMFSNGGTGGRTSKDGLSATSFPSGVQNIPVEIIESTTPLFVQERALRPGSGGDGEHRGGLGQVLTLSLREGEAVYSTIYERLHHPASGRRGGLPGMPGRVTRSDGEAVHGKRKARLPAGVRVRIELPGGGGWGDPGRRGGGERTRDIREGYVLAEGSPED